jgi:hypothetical protein
MKAQTVKEVLVATKWILEHTGWCQGASGMDKDGIKCRVQDPKCVSRCLTGAIYTVEADTTLLNQAHYLIEGDLNSTVIKFNDTWGRTKQEVLDLLVRVIERAT